MKAFYRVIIFVGICAALVGIRGLWVGYAQISNSELESKLIVDLEDMKDLVLRNSKPDPCIGVANPSIDLDCLRYNLIDRPAIEVRKIQRLESHKNRLDSDGRFLLFIGVASLIISALLLTFGFGKLKNLSKQES